MIRRPPRSTLFPSTPLSRSSGVSIGYLPIRQSFKSVGGRDVQQPHLMQQPDVPAAEDRKSTRLNSSHQIISYAVFCLKKKKIKPRHIQKRKRTDAKGCARDI